MTPDTIAWSDSTSVGETLGGENLGRGYLRFIAALAVKLPALLEMKDKNDSLVLFRAAPFWGNGKSLFAIEQEKVIIPFLQFRTPWMLLVDTVYPLNRGNRILRSESRIVPLLNEQ